MKVTLFVRTPDDRRRVVHGQVDPRSHEVPLRIIEDVDLPRVPQMGETVDFHDRVYTVSDVQTVLFGEKAGRIFVTIEEHL